MNPAPRKFPIGKSDFASVRQGNYHYVDKSLFIEQIVQDGAEVLLFPRPRRFGKTLNLSMLRYFFEKPKGSKEGSTEDRRTLFTGLAIEKSKEAWEHFQRYPILFLTFKDVKVNSWANAFDSIVELIVSLYEEHRYLLVSSVLSKEQAQIYHDILSRKANLAQYERSLFELSKYLHQHHGEKVVILIDEYDTCLHEAYAKGYYEEAISFFRITIFDQCGP